MPSGYKRSRVRSPHDNSNNKRSYHKPKNNSQLKFLVFLIVVIMPVAALFIFKHQVVAIFGGTTIATHAPTIKSTLTPALTSALTQTQSQTQTQTQTPIPTLAPATTPTPAPTPHPWAGFSPEGPRLYIKDFNNGPWAYMDQTLNVMITIQGPGILTNPYYLSDIHTRGGELPFTGFAKKNRKGTSTELPYKIGREYKAVLAITGQYVTAPENPKGVIICNGLTYFNKADASSMAFLPSGEMKVYEPGEITARKLRAMGVKDAFAFGPILVKDGKVCAGLDNVKRQEYHSWRAAIGQVEPGHYIIIVTNGGVLLPDLAQLFVQYGCQIAYNLDGGYSAAIVFMGEQLNKNSDTVNHQRTIPDMLMIGSCSAVPDVKAPVYGNGLIYSGAEPQPTDGLLQISK